MARNGQEERNMNPIEKRSMNRLNLAVTVMAVLAACTPCANAVELCRTTFNPYQVFNGTVRPTICHLDHAATVTQIVTYHWNGGQGKAPGSISLLALGGPVSVPNSMIWHHAQGQPGAYNVPNVNWVATMFEELPAGDYAVWDSDPATLSQNLQSGGFGFGMVEGTYKVAADLRNNFNGGGVGDRKSVV